MQSKTFRGVLHCSRRNLVISVDLVHLDSTWGKTQSEAKYKLMLSLQLVLCLANFLRQEENNIFDMGFWSMKVLNFVYTKHTVLGTGQSWSSITFSCRIGYADKKGFISIQLLNYTNYGELISMWYLCTGILLVVPPRRGILVILQQGKNPDWKKTNLANAQIHEYWYNQLLGHKPSSLTPRCLEMEDS